MDVEPVDLGDELRQGVQLRLAPCASRTPSPNSARVSASWRAARPAIHRDRFPSRATVSQRCAGGDRRAPLPENSRETAGSHAVSAACLLRCGVATGFGHGVLLCGKAARANCAPQFFTLIAIGPRRGAPVIQPRGFAISGVSDLDLTRRSRRRSVVKQIVSPSPRQDNVELLNPGRRAENVTRISIPLGIVFRYWLNSDLRHSLLIKQLRLGNADIEPSRARPLNL